MKHLTRDRFGLQARGRNVIWIDPARVHAHNATKIPVTKYRIAQARRVLPNAVINPFRPLLRRHEPFFTPKRHWGPSTPIVETYRYRIVADFLTHLETPENSRWFADLDRQLAATGKASHKDIIMHSRDDIADFFATYVTPMITSLEQTGYDPKYGFESVAVINAKGEIMKSGSGNHRFNVAKALGLATYPLRIVGAHEDWIATQCVETIVTALQEVERRHSHTAKHQEFP